MIRHDARFGSRYRIIDKVGEGGFAEVFLVEDRLRATQVALKAFKRSLTGIDLRALLRGEFLALARFEHPGLPKVYDVSIDGGSRPFFTLDYLPGPDVVGALRTEAQGPIPCARIEAVQAAAIAILSVLRYIHSRGVVHGDLKPSNILYRHPPALANAGAGLVLVDFGLHLPQAREHGISGTLCYLAPELLSGGTVSRQTDLFALGVILYEMLAGTNPFTGSDPVLRARGLGPQVRPLSSLLPGLPSGIEEAVSRLLAVDPAARYQTAEEAQRALLLTSSWSTERVAASLQEGFRLDPGAVGSRAILTAFRDTLGKVVDDGRGELLTVRAAPGSGVPRLLAQFRAETLSRGCRFLSLEIGSEPISRTMTTLLEHVAAEPAALPIRGRKARSTPREVTVVATERMDLNQSQQDRFERWFQTLLKAARPAARHEPSPPPLVLALHGCEQATASLARFLGFLARQRRRLPLLLVAAGAEGHWEAELPASEMWPLGPLSLAEVEEVVQTNFFGLPHPTQLARVLLARSNGSLDLLVDLAADLVTSGALRPTPDGWRANLSLVRAARLRAASLGTSLDRWLARDSEDRRILEAIAILGGRADAPALTAVSGILASRAVPRLEDLAASGLVAVEPATRGESLFRLDVPDLAGEALRQLPPPRRLDLSRRAVAHLTRRVASGDLTLLEPLATLQVDLGRTLAAAANFARLGELQRAQQDVERAFDSFATAVRLLRAGKRPIPARLLEAQVEVALATGRSDEAMASARRLFALPGTSPGRRAAYALWAGLAAQQAGTPKRARAWLARAIDAAQAAPSPIGIEARRALARLELAEGRHQEAEALYVAAAQDATAMGPAHRHLLLRVLMGQGEGRIARGDRDGAKRCFVQALRLARARRLAPRRPRVELGLGELLLEEAPLAAQEHLERAAAGAAAGGDAVTEAWARYNLGIVLGDLGHGDASRAAYLEARDLFARCGRWEEARAEAQLGNLAREQGDLAQAKAHYQRFEGLTHQMPAGHPSRLMLRLNRWQVALAEGDAATVLVEAEAAAAEFPSSHPRSHLAWRWIVAQARRNAGDARRAVEEADELLRLSRESNNRSIEILSLLLLAELAQARGEREEARVLGQQARIAAARLGSAILEAKAELLLADLTIGDGAPGADPSPHLEVAQRVFTSAGMRPLLAHVSALRDRWEKQRRRVNAEPEAEGGKELRTLYRAAEIIRSYSDLTSVLENLLDAVLDLMGAERGVVFLKHPATRRLELRASRGGDRTVVRDASRLSQTILRQTLSSARPVTSTNAMMDPRFRDNKSVANFGIRSFICAPLLLPDRAIGTVYIDQGRADRTFSAGDAEFLMALTGFAAFAIDNALRQGTMRRRVEQLTREVASYWDPGQFVAASPSMRKVLDDVRRVAPGDATVLIRGESGTGKELIARMLHDCSPRVDGPFVVVNCAAIPAGLVESELFGIVRGAATDVVEHAGKLEDAQGGTLFLDEIGELPPAAQAKILRAIQERHIERVGSSRTIALDFRLVAATNADLEAALEAGTFRRDLYYRLKVVELVLPPLRERREDIPPLISHYVERISRDLSRPRPEVPQETLRSYVAHAWPGNVRELRNALERAVLFSDGTPLPPLAGATGSEGQVLDVPDAFTEQLTEREFRSRYARHVFERLGRNKLRTCEFLGIDFKTLKARLEPSA